MDRLQPFMGCNLSLVKLASSQLAYVLKLQTEELLQEDEPPRRPDSLPLPVPEAGFRRVEEDCLHMLA